MALCFSAVVTTTSTKSTGRSRRRQAARFLVVSCCDTRRRSDLLSSSLAAKVLGAPTTFDATKLKVEFAGGEQQQRRAFPRAYTLSHCDFTANLTLAVSDTITSDQLSRWRWQRDDVFAEWKEMSSSSGMDGEKKTTMTLHLHCHVSGPSLLQELAAGFRYYVFSKELPLVLKAVLHGDGALFAEQPELMEAKVWVHFHSTKTKYNRIECWGTLREAAKRNRLLDELQSAITTRPTRLRTPSETIFNALITLLL